MATYIERHIKEKPIEGIWHRDGIHHKIRKIMRSISQIITVDEEAIYKSRDWPYFWAKK